MLDALVPLLLAGLAVAALIRRQDAYGALLAGGKEGLTALLSVLPALVVLLSAVSMLRASGAAELVGSFLAPVARWLGLPAEILPLALVRPFSGSAALALGAELIGTYGADSLIGRTAAILLGSTETTFYAVSVYFGAVGIGNTRHSIPAALLADVTGLFLAALTARLL